MKSIFLALIVLVLSAFDCNASPETKNSMSTQPSKIICAGRHLIELPKSSLANISASFHFMNPKKVVPIRDYASLRNELIDRSNQYHLQNMVVSERHARMARAAGFDPEKVYGKTQLVGFNEDDQLNMIIISYHPDTTSSEVITEAHRAFGQWDYVFEATQGTANNFPAAQSRVLAAIRDFLPLEANASPENAGFCVQNGYFSDSGESPVRERFTISVTLPDHPDARFVIDAIAIDNVDHDEPSLKHRVDGELRILKANVEGHVNTIVRGNRKAAGQDGYEIGIGAPYDLVPGTRIRKFFWSADGVPNDVTRPYMEVQLMIEPREDGTTSVKDDKEAKALWDQLLEGIRIRPGAI